MARFSLLLIAAFTGIVTARQCYYPDGSESTDVPCSEAETTHCCAETSICMSNGYCLNSWPSAYGIGRGSCTNVDWDNPCPQECINSQYNNVDGGDNAVLLKVVSGTNYYCCGIIVSDNDTVACPNSQDPFVLGEASMLIGYAALANVTSTSDSATSTTTGTTTASDASTPTANNACQNGDTSASTKIGVGVGVSLGAAALGALAWAFWERRKRTNATKMAGTGFGPGVGNGLVQYSAVPPQWSDYQGKTHAGGVQGGYSQSATQAPFVQEEALGQAKPAVQAELQSEPPCAEMMAPGRDGHVY